MKKHLLLASILAAIFIKAQVNNSLEIDLENQRKENLNKFNEYIRKKHFTNNEAIDDEMANLAGFMPNGKPYFYKQQDIRQGKNANSDLLNTTGNVSGLINAYNGEGIKYTIFDGGRIYAAHPAFDNLPNRITNKEASTQIYSAHSTGVAGFVGAKSLTITGTINGVPTSGDIKGIANLSTMDSYRFATTTLPGNSSSSTIFQKILIAQPAISNHSYGSNVGWDTDTINGSTVWYWNGAFTSPNISYDVQGTYLGEDQNYDNIVYNNPSYIIVKSAGNSFGMGPDYPGTSSFSKYYEDDNGNDVQFTASDILPASNCAGGFDCIGPGSLAKNIIVVGATDVITSNNFRYSVASDVIHSDYSSAGPRDDGAIKPDISTTGTDVFSPATAQNTTGSTTYDYGSGTSYSAPVITGVIGLWAQIYKDLFSGQALNAASAKTLMVHSASEAGNIGPDPLFGWGYINAKKGAELLVGKANNSIIFSDETLSSGITKKISLKASGSEPLKVTISWIDPAYKVPSNLTLQSAYNNRSSRLVNDLDVRIIDTTTNTIYYPWKLNANSPMIPAAKGDNTVDNVEQAILDNPVSGRTYRIEITNKGSLVNYAGAVAPQNYSVIVTGYSQILTAGDVKSTNNIITVVPSLTQDFTSIVNAPKNSKFSVYDASGKKLQTGVIIVNKQNIDLSTYSNGLYMIEIITENGIINKKVIKQ